MCKLSKNADSIFKEDNWPTKTTVLDVNTLKAFLLNARPNDKAHLPQMSDLSTVVCECYVNAHA